MKVIVAGSRNFNNYSLLEKTLNSFSETHGSIEIVSGGARGADTLGERYAKEHNCPLKVFPAEWDKFGKGAGYIRNAEMAAYADALVAFWDGQSKGTKHMIELAQRSGLTVQVERF